MSKETISINIKEETLEKLRYFMCENCSCDDYSLDGYCDTCHLATQKDFTEWLSS